MASTVTADQDLYYHSFPIEKMETDPATGTLYVYGKATTPEVDSDEQIVDPDWSAKAMSAWFETGPNVRVQHNASLMPAGSGVKVEIDRDGDQAHWVKAAIDEPVAKLMCSKGHLRAFSVGIARPLIVRDVSGKARGGIIKGGELAEISLVDRPANRSCYVELAKAAGADGHAEFTGKVGGADLLVKSLAEHHVAGDDLDDPEFAGKVGPHGFVHGWIKVGSGAHDNLNRGLDGNVGATVGRHLDAAYSAHQSGDHGAALRHLSAAKDAVRYNGGLAGNKPLTAAIDSAVSEVKGSMKTAVPDVVQLELPADVSVSFTPGDLAKLLEGRRVAEDNQIGKDWATWDQTHGHMGQARAAGAAEAAGRKPAGNQAHWASEAHHQHLLHEAHEAHLRGDTAAQNEYMREANQQHQPGKLPAKPAAKPAAKPGTSSASKPASKPAATSTSPKPAAKPKPEAKPAAKPAAKPPAKPAAKPDAAREEHAREEHAREAAHEAHVRHEEHLQHEAHEGHLHHEHAEHLHHEAHTAHQSHEAAVAAREQANTRHAPPASASHAAQPEPHQAESGNLAHANAITAETAGKTAGRDEAVNPGEPEPRKPGTPAREMGNDPQETDPGAHAELDDAQRAGPGAKSTSAQSPKRDFDPNVGGGTDRDKLPAADFAGRGRSFPIKTPGDVSDAALSIGRAGDGNYGPDQLRSNITRIAHRKGPEFVAELPESWRNDGAGKAASVDHDEDLTKGEKCGLCKGTGKIREGHVKCPRCKGSGEMGGEVEEADLAKAGKRACKECGKNHHSDFPGKFCEGCGAELPPAGKAAGGDADEAMDADLAKAGKASDDDGEDLAEDDDESDDDPDDGEDDGDDADESPEDDDAEDDDAEDAKSTKSGKPSPGDGVRGEHTSGVPAHREPDGRAVEDLEHDARLPTDPDADYEQAAHTRFKTLGVPGDLGRLHDLTCAAYHPDDVAKSHPGATLAGVINTDEWARAAFTAATSAPLDEAAKSQLLWQDAVTVKAADPVVLAEVTEAVHKAFQDANPGPGHAPTPVELSPGRCNRPYITAGHAAPSPGHEAPNRARVPSSDITAAEFDRAALTAGHAAASADKGGRLFYRNTARDQIHQAMAAIHDHIAQTFPSLCPMSGSSTAEPMAEGHKSAAADGPDIGGRDADGLAYDAAGTRKWLAEQVIKGDMTVPEAREVLGLPPLGFPADGLAGATSGNWAGKAAAGGGAYSPDLIKAAVTEVTGPLLAKLEEQGEALVRQGRMLRKQQKVLDVLADAPDPDVAPYRGPAFPNPASMAPVGSIEPPTVTKAAERSQMAVMRNLADEWRNSPDPAMRERAWQALSGQLGIAGNGTTH